MKVAHTLKVLSGFFLTVLLLASCKKEEEMLLMARVVSPVLVTIQGVEFAATEPVSVTAGIYELNKAGLLDHTVGIDSIPVSNLALEVKANGAVLESLMTNTDGKVVLGKTWSQLGIAAPVEGNTVNLEWSGTYKGQAFTKLSRVQVK